jgi:hypothetical protein
MPALSAVYVAPPTLSQVNQTIPSIPVKQEDKMVTRRGKRSRGAWWLAAGAFLLIGMVYMSITNSAFAKKYVDPDAAKGDVVDNYHGTNIADPYRGLEDPDSKETVAWVAKENELTRAYIDSYPKRDAIEQRLTKLWNYAKYSLPNKQGDRYFFSKNDGLQNQSVLYMQKSLDGQATVVIDPTRQHRRHRGTLGYHVHGRRNPDGVRGLGQR